MAQTVKNGAGNVRGSTSTLTPVLPTSSDVEHALAFAKRGTPLLKIRSKLSKNKRHFYVDEDGLVLKYRGSGKINGLRKLLRQKSKKEDMSTIYLSDIKEIREGALSDKFDFVYSRTELPRLQDRCFVILVGERYDTLDLIARTSEERAMWIEALNHLKQNILHQTEFNPRALRNAYLKVAFEEADKNKNGTLELKEVIKILNDNNAFIEESYAKELCMKAKVKTAAVNGNGQIENGGAEHKNMFFKHQQLSLDVDEFITFSDDLMKRTEIDAIFKKYDHGKGYLTSDDLQKFFRDNHDNEVTLEDIEGVIQRCETVPDLKEKSYLSEEGFDNMFNTSFLEIRKTECHDVYQDMTRPLSHYYIDSSHNTYIQSNQLTGDSRVESYVIALRSGCRCVELDVWDGEEEPEIFHGLGGFTMTSKILFRDVIEVVDKFAFETTEYPVILSLENHCSVEQQTMMARFMRTMLGDKLLTEPLSEDCTELPSPEQLKCKVIVKSKKISSPTELNYDIEELCGDLDDEEGGEESEEAAELKKKKVEEVMNKKGAKSHELSQELSDCIVICRATGFKSFEKSAKSSFAEMSSFSENKALKLIASDLDGYIKHNQRQFSRIYPAGSRTGSSNFDPLPMWLAGCQIVALNIQTPDAPMHINKGLFEDNGRCGYVLKPEFLTSATPACKALGPYPESWKKTMKIKVISGYRLPKKEGDVSKSILDPYIKVTVTGVPADLKEYQTKVIQDNGFNPNWNEEFDFTVLCPSFSFLYFQVYDSSNTSTDPIVAQYCLPFSCVRSGFRTIPLKTPTGEPINNGGQLLVHITIT